MHYLDDFLLVGGPASEEFRSHLSILLTTFDRLGLPMAPHKLEGPVGNRVRRRHYGNATAPEKTLRVEAVGPRVEGGGPLMREARARVSCRKTAACVPGGSTGEDIPLAHLRAYVSGSQQAPAYSPK